MLEYKPHIEKKLLTDKVAIVTGAAQGIGKGIALELFQEGANIVLADINEAKVQTVAKEMLYSSGKKVFTISIDITSEADRVKLIMETLDRFGKIDILVNNAAIVSFEQDIMIYPSEEQTHAVFNTNYHAPRILGHKVAKYMQESKVRGSIIFITSVHARHVRMQEHYHASKAALEATMLEMAVQYAPFGIRVNAVAPGAIYTSESPTPDDLSQQLLREEVPLGRLGLPQEVAKAVVFLSSENFSSYITGSTLVVDGGLSEFNWITRHYLRNPFSYILDRSGRR